jgi:hypothetical protein
MDANSGRAIAIAITGALFHAISTADQDAMLRQ